MNMYRMKMGRPWMGRGARRRSSRKEKRSIVIPYFLLSSEMYVWDCRFCCCLFVLYLHLYFSHAFFILLLALVFVLVLLVHTSVVFTFSAAGFMLMLMLLIMYMRALRAGLTSRLDRNRNGWMGINKCTRFVEWNGMGLKGLGYTGLTA